MTRHLTRHMRPHASKVMVVYSRSIGVRRRVIDADHDGEYDLHVAHLHPGEGHFFLSHTEYDAHVDPHALNHTTALKAGFDKAPHPRADVHRVVHPHGHTVAIVHADPTCGDTGEHFGSGHTLVKHGD